MRFTLSLLAVVLAFALGVFAEHDFAVVNMAKQEVNRQCDCASCNCCEGCAGNTKSGCCKQSTNKPMPRRCTCGCEETGQCSCPNCSVGCGFLPAPLPKK